MFKSEIKRWILERLRKLALGGEDG